MTSNQVVFSSPAYDEALEAQTLLYVRHRITCEVRADPDGAWMVEFHPEQQTDDWIDLESVRRIVRVELNPLERFCWSVEFAHSAALRELDTP